MTSTHDPIVCQFKIVADVGEAQDGWEFKGLFDALQPTRRLVVPIEYRHLQWADYTVEGLPLYIVRRQASDLAALLRHSPATVRKAHQELAALEAGGASCLLVIEGNPQEIEEIMAADPIAESSQGASIPWMFVPDRHTAELMVLAIIQKTWLQLQSQ